MGGVASRKEVLCMCTDDIATHTSDTQIEAENDCARFYVPAENLPSGVLMQLRASGMVASEDDEVKPMLLKQKTADYLRKGLMVPLGSSYTSLDASRPWLIYWMLHALVLIGAFPADIVENIRDGLKSCIAVDKLGFGGGFMQDGHTAPTYAAVLALCSLGDEESLKVIDRQSIYRFFMNLKDPCGGFKVQKDGEMDTRGLYTVLAVSSILNILTPELTANCAEFVKRCQTYEGGFGGEPGNEAHGGYSFCAIASVAILGRFDAINVEAFVDWFCGCQMRYEGGFQGRSNKLVDSCYSFWQGGTPAILEKYLGIRMEIEGMEGSQLYDQTRLQQYIILCCQFKEGGLRDKPSKYRDQYHTCYSLSGLSCSQQGGKAVWGHASNALAETDPVYNIHVDKLKLAMAHFKSLPPL